MYRISKHIEVDMAHHVSGHEGACINIHGHTWRFEVCLAAETLDARGFVVDFKELKTRVLEPIHLLLDHALALYEHTIEAAKPQLITLGQILVSTRQAGQQLSQSKDPKQTPYGYKALPPAIHLAGAQNIILGGIKIASFPFSPTSERLAEWAFVLAHAAFKDDRVRADWVKVYETLHPVESVATFSA